MGCDPEKDIPNYRPEKHVKLRNTIVSEFETIGAEKRTLMACHYSKPDAEIPCAGWMHYQLGVGNDFGLRIAVMTGLHPAPVVDGPQHATFEETLPKKRRRKLRQR